MHKKLKNIDAQASKMLLKIQELEDIVETIYDALNYCSDNVKDCSHISSVVGVLKLKLGDFVSDVENHEQEILKLVLNSQPE